MKTNRMILALVVGLTAAACGSSSGADATSSTIPGTTTTSIAVPESTTTSTPPATTTTVSPTTTMAGPFTPGQPPSLEPPPSLDGTEGDGSSGSGCSPGEGPLPDGVWYGYVLEDLPMAVSFDLACIWFGDIAYEVGGAAGVEVNNDVYIENANPTAREVPLSPETVVWTIAGDPTQGHSEVPYADWPLPQPTYTPCPGENCSVWLYINGGLVTEIVEQYLP